MGGDSKSPTLTPGTGVLRSERFNVGQRYAFAAESKPHT